VFVLFVQLFPLSPWLLFGISPVVSLLGVAILAVCLIAYDKKN